MSYNIRAFKYMKIIIPIIVLFFGSIQMNPNLTFKRFLKSLWEGDPEVEGNLRVVTEQVSFYVFNLLVLITIYKQ